MTQADRQAALGIAIHKQNLLAFGGQSDAQIGAGGGLADSALLIGDGYYIGTQIFLPPSFQIFRIYV